MVDRASSFLKLMSCSSCVLNSSACSSSGPGSKSSSSDSSSSGSGSSFATCSPSASSGFCISARGLAMYSTTCAIISSTFSMSSSASSKAPVLSYSALAFRNAFLASFRAPSVIFFGIGLSPSGTVTPSTSFLAILRCVSPSARREYSKSSSLSTATSRRWRCGRAPIETYRLLAPCTDRKADLMSAALSSISVCWSTDSKTSSAWPSIESASDILSILCLLSSSLLLSSSASWRITRAFRSLSTSLILSLDSSASSSLDLTVLCSLSAA
mmetsp:Transcript_13876/g.35443  ORF Transcript_13876/g.35443 Transcript_13876/m.35443 type:complete len:270 (-) Transcript_13876:97-906(-)